MIVQAAVRFEGQIYTGRRHVDVLRNMITVHRIRTAVREGEQGFVNDNNEFLTRTEAAKEALACGQIDKLPIGGELISDQLW